MKTNAVGQSGKNMEEREIVRELREKRKALVGAEE
jgi:hypothetical protein